MDAWISTLPLHSCFCLMPPPASQSLKSGVWQSLRPSPPTHPNPIQAPSANSFHTCLFGPSPPPSPTSCPHLISESQEPLQCFLCSSALSQPNSVWLRGNCLPWQSACATSLVNPAVAPTSHKTKSDFLRWTAVGLYNRACQFLHPVPDLSFSTGQNQIAHHFTSTTGALFTLHPLPGLPPSHWWFPDPLVFPVETQTQASWPAGCFTDHPGWLNHPPMAHGGTCRSLPQPGSVTGERPIAMVSQSLPSSSCSTQWPPRSGK